MSGLDQETIRQMFQRMDGERQERIRSSEQFAYYTIPSIFPREDNGDNSQGVGMLDSIGSAVLNHFANKLVTTLFSPNRPFFRLTPASDNDSADDLEEAMNDTSDPEAQKQAIATMNAFRRGASRVEKKAVAQLEKISYRTAAVECAKLLVATGDAVIKNPGDGKKPTVYSMKNYVALKDGAGKDRILILRDVRAFASFSDTMQTALQDSTTDKTYQPTTEVSVYTKYELQDDGRYLFTQATDEVDLLSADRVLIPEDAMIHTHLSWNVHNGENYGRGLVEDFSGAFHMVDSISRTQAALAARIAAQKIFVSPQSNIDVQELNGANSNSYVSGDPAHIGTEKLADPQDIVALGGVKAEYVRQISAAFLYSSGATRDAERVTAEEIRENAAELEVAHGGVYSRFSGEWQRKAAQEAVAAVDQPLPEEVDAQIITGMDSLSRQGEMQAVRVWMQDLAMLNGVPEHMQSVIKPSQFAEYTALQRGVDHTAFVMTEDEMKQAQEAAQQQEAAMQQQEQQARQDEIAMKGAQ